MLSGAIVKPKACFDPSLHVTIMEPPTIPIPCKRSRHTGYNDMRKLTEAYLRKVKHTLQDQRCTDNLHNSLQLYLASSVFPRESVEARARTATLAFIMHAVEVVDARIAENTHKKAEISSQTEHTLPEPAVSKDPLVTTTKLPTPKPHFTHQTTPKPAETVQQSKKTSKPQQYKAIFKIEIGREAKPVHIPPSQPSVSLYQPRPEFYCETCGEDFWDREDLSVHRNQQLGPKELLSERISCPILSCEELFEDHSDLLLHMRSVHSS